MRIIGEFEINDTSNIVMLPRASTYVSIKFADKCIQIINNKDRLNGLKGRKKFKRENRYSKTNHVFTTFKGTLISSIEV